MSSRKRDDITAKEGRFMLHLVAQAQIPLLQRRSTPNGRGIVAQAVNLSGCLAASLLLTTYAAAQPTSNWTFTTIYNGNNLTDLRPIVVGKDNVIYGTTYAVGQIYSLSPPTTSSMPWTFTSLHTGGAAPYAGVTLGEDGVLYGTTRLGGGGDQAKGCGTAYSLEPPASEGGAATYRVLYRFLNDNCARPEKGLAIGSGRVAFGVANNTIYSLTPPAVPGKAWTYTALYAFSGEKDGAWPLTLTIGPDGVLYGVTSRGGAGEGTAFSLTPPPTPGGSWTFNVLCVFPSGGYGTGPSVLTLGEKGVLYGTTAYGGNVNSSCPDGCGTIFAITPPEQPGGSWSLNTIYSFAGGNDGAYPSGIAVDKKGNLVGGARGAGANGYGTIFALTAPGAEGGPWTETTLYSLTGYPNGCSPINVALGTDAIYGAATDCGTCPFPYSCGTIFSLSHP
jgi:hypothetical protein